MAPISASTTNTATPPQTNIIFGDIFFFSAVSGGGANGARFGCGLGAGRGGRAGSPIFFCTAPSSSFQFASAWSPRQPVRSAA